MVPQTEGLFIKLIFLLQLIYDWKSYTVIWIIQDTFTRNFKLLFKLLFGSIWISCCFWRALSLPHKNDLINFGRKYIWHNDINALKQIFKLNRDPIQFIDRCIKQLLQKLYVTKATKNTADKKQLVVVLTCLGSQSILFMKVV